MMRKKILTSAAALYLALALFGFISLAAQEPAGIQGSKQSLTSETVSDEKNDQNNHLFQNGSANEEEPDGQEIQKPNANSELDPSDHAEVEKRDAVLCPIFAGCSAGGSIRPSGTVQVPYDGTQSFEITPDEGYSIKEVMVDEQPVSGVTDHFDFKNVRDIHSIVVKFVKDGETDVNYLFATSCTKGGTVTPSGETLVKEQGTIHILFQADHGYYVQKVTIDGRLEDYPFGYETDHFTVDWMSPDRSHNVYGVFKKIEPAQFTITASCSTGGKITPQGQVSVTECEDMTFEFAPDPGYFIKDMKVDGKSKDSDLKQYTFDYVDQDHSIEVEFAKSELTIAASCGEGGKITPAGTVTVRNGDSQTFEIAPDKGCAVKDVKVDGESKGPLTVYKFESAEADHTIQAEFKKAESAITASAGSGGKIAPEGTVTVRNGDSPTFEFMPDRGYAVKDVKVDGESKGPLTVYQFESVDADHTIQVEFEQAEYTIRVSSAAGGTITPGKDVTVKKGEDAEFVIKPDTGYEISDVKVDGVSKGKLNSYKFEKVNEGHTISAVFSKTAADPSASTIPASSSGANTGIQTDLFLWSGLIALVLGCLIMAEVRAWNKEF